MKKINILGIGEDELSKEYLISLDTNILLDIYRKSNSYSNTFLSILSDLKDLNILWISNQVKEEFFKNKSNTLKTSKKK